MCAAVLLFSWPTVCYYVTILFTDSVIDEHGSFFQLLPFTDNDAMNPLAFSNPKSYQFHLVRLKKRRKRSKWRSQPGEPALWISHLGQAHVPSEASKAVLSFRELDVEEKSHRTASVAGELVGGGDLCGV